MFGYNMEKLCSLANRHQQHLIIFRRIFNGISEHVRKKEVCEYWLKPNRIVALLTLLFKLL